MLFGACLGVVVGVLIGTFLVRRTTPPRPDPSLATWFLLTGAFGAASIVVWINGLPATSPGDHSGTIVLGTATVIFAPGFAMMRRHPAAALALLLGVTGFAIGSVLDVALIPAAWGAEVGAVLGIAVGIADATLAGWHVRRSARYRDWIGVAAP